VPAFGCEAVGGLKSFMAGSASGSGRFFRPAQLATDPRAAANIERVKSEATLYHACVRRCEERRNLEIARAARIASSPRRPSYKSRCAQVARASFVIRSVRYEEFAGIWQYLLTLFRPAGSYRSRKIRFE
jgi:hypothetical protein